MSILLIVLFYRNMTEHLARSEKSCYTNQYLLNRGSLFLRQVKSLRSDEYGAQAKIHAIRMELLMDNSVENRILEAAFKVIDEHTISGTRMHLIAQECGMAQSNLHYHFKTKRELLVALLDHIQAKFNETRSETMGQFPDTLKGQLAGFFRQKKNIILEEPQYDRVQMDYWSLGQVDGMVNASIDKSYTIWREHVRDTILKYDPEQDPEKVNIAAHIMISMLCGSSIQYLCNPSFDLEAYNEACLTMIEKYLE